MKQVILHRLSATAIAFFILFAATSMANAKEVNVRGSLQKTVEGGGWLIANERDKYLILNPANFQKESWFKVSTLVDATGDTKPDAITTAMEGTPLEVHSMHPVEDQNASGPDSIRRTTRVLVVGDATVNAQPDTAVIVISVVTQGKNAIEAQQENATRSDAVVRAVKTAAGAGAEVKTSGYSLQPQRVYKEGVPPTITGYEARNSVTVTLGDLTRIGTVIDASGGAGANDVGGISFTLRQDRPARDQALRAATRDAVTKATVIAQALGGRLIRIIEVQEEGAQRPVPTYSTEAYMARSSNAATTPVEVGSLEIKSRVQIIAEVDSNL